MNKGIVEYIKDNLLVGDGAMGTLLHRYGVPVGSCAEELNLTQPHLVLDIHQKYIQAGATLIETNTFGANYEKLQKYGLEDQVKEINLEAVKLARRAAAGKAYVVGAVGAVLGAKKRHPAAWAELRHVYEQQISHLLEAGVDGIMLETFCYAEEALLALQTVRKLSDLPVICQLSIQESRMTQDGLPLETAFQRLREEGADIVGLNCYHGPAQIIRSLEILENRNELLLSAYPNAGLPDYVDGEIVYGSSPEYFAQSALRLQQTGVRMIGGCCGTTPQHIEAAAQALRGRKPMLMEPSAEQKEEIADTALIRISSPAKPQTLPDLVRQQTTIIVELDPPRDLDYHPYMEGAAALKEAGVDAITLADNSLAMCRMSNMALGAMIKEQVGIRPLVHMTCRDRNLIGQQSHLMGLYALGIDHVLVVTGDPTRFGDLPGASSVYDMSSFDLIRMIKQLNEGTSFSGRALKHQAGFTVAAAFNPNTRHLDKAVQRLEKKMTAGADYVLSQPIFCHEQIRQVAGATAHLPIPIFLGIMPLTSSRNAEFLHNEVPGIRLSDEVRERMARFTGEDARKQGMEIAMELVETAQRYFRGIYLITPFMRYEMTVELTRMIKRNPTVYVGVQPNSMKI
jgi:methionine synthase I (cobalamin-dependent)/5,10-methylenetetrahydrofolate reductase